MTDNYGTVLEYVLSGDAIVFIGSGASSEMGYPSWSDQLSIVEDVAKDKNIELTEEYQEYKRVNQLPQAFEYLESRIGRDLLLKTLKDTLSPEFPSNDSIYNILTKWPFKLYLTTNYDDEIISHLRSNGRNGFSVICNSQADFSAITPDAQEYVIKLHGELHADRDAVVTDKDYDEFKNGKERSYYRRTLAALLRHRHVVFVGYSMSDPDLQYILNRMSEDGSLISPICVLLPDPTRQQVAKLSRSMSIRVIPYSNTDKRHSALKKVLSILNSFINPSTSTVIHTEDSKNAAALYLFRHLTNTRANLSVEDNLLLLIPSGKTSAWKIEKISKEARISIETCHKQIDALRGQKLIRVDGDLVSLSNAGVALIKKCRDAFDVAKKSALNHFIDEIGIALSRAEESQYERLADTAISNIFNSRGLSLVNSLWGHTEITSGELLDIYTTVSNVAAEIQDLEKRLLFIQAIKKFVFSPSYHQKEYLVALSQGYFMYHLRGNSLAAQKATSTFISRADWYVDSHILQALVAEGCGANSFVTGLFDLLHRKGAKIFVTPGVIEEVLYHFDEADRQSPCKNADFYQTAISLLRDKYNFFLDGYIQSQAKNIISSYRQYSKRINQMLNNRMASVLAKYSIKEVNVDRSKQSVQEGFDIIAKEVEKIRRKKNKEEEPNQLKIQTDAEIYMAITTAEDEYKRCGIQRNVYFISHSTVFDRVNRKLNRWTDFALYRLLSSFPNEKAPMESMYDCLHSELVSAGLRIVDDKNYELFFSEQIEAAKLNFKEEYKEYLEQIEASALIDENIFEKGFNNLPDLEKPIFIEEMRSRLAKRDKQRVLEEVARREAVEKDVEKYKQQIKSLQEQLDRATADADRLRRRNQVELNTYRNSLNPKHVSKKLRQAKKRLRKRSKR